MTADRRPSVADAAARATVSFPGQLPGTTATGALHAVTARHAKIRLTDGTWATRPVEVVRLVLEAPRSVP